MDKKPISIPRKRMSRESDSDLKSSPSLTSDKQSKKKRITAKRSQKDLDENLKMIDLHSVKELITEII